MTPITLNARVVIASLAILVAFFVATAGFAAWLERPRLHQQDAHVIAWQQHNNPPKPYDFQPGLGVSFSGKPGLEVMPGVIITSSGIKLGVGL